MKSAVGIPVFIINLKNRTDRKAHIIGQFSGRNEFQVRLVHAFKHKFGAVGLWNTIKYILQDMVDKKNEYIILCEDDHEFTTDYSKELLMAHILEARERNADILSLGVSGFTGAIQASKYIFWVEVFSGIQFTVIFRKFFKKILNADFKPGQAADYKMCSLTQNKYFIYPFLSVQKDFGYSDATANNNVRGQVEKLFIQSREKVQILKNVRNYYFKKTEISKDLKLYLSPSKVIIPTYIIHLPGREDRLIHIKQQFVGKSEFDVSIIEANRHKKGRVGLWMSIKRIIEIAGRNHDDLILICEDDHQFTHHYSKTKFIKSVWRAATLGCNVLSGGIGGFNTCMQITPEIFWIDSFWCTQFIVIYKRIFKQILDESFSENDTADGKFSEMTSHKMVLFPFISVQKDFGYSDVTIKTSEIGGLTTRYFKSAEERLENFNDMNEKFIISDKSRSAGTCYCDGTKTECS